MQLVNDRKVEPRDLGDCEDLYAMSPDLWEVEVHGAFDEIPTDEVLRFVEDNALCCCSNGTLISRDGDVAVVRYYA